MLYIIRHGETAKNRKNVLQGRSDQPLNDLGMDQAEEAGALFSLKGIRFDAVYSSPLIRAVQTAEQILKRGEAGRSLPDIIKDSRLIEMDYGPYEGMDLTDPAPEVMAFFMDFAGTPAPEGMEQLSSVVARLGDFLEEIREELFSLQDTAYRDFQGKLTPTIDASTAIGVRTPALRAMAKRVVKRKDVGAFLDDLPHAYFDENQLHAFIISELRDYEACLQEVERFLPYVDNWATCDQMSPKVFKKHRAELIDPIKRWISSDATYTLRFGVGMLMEHYLDDDWVGMLMEHYLDDDFDPAYLDMVAAVRSEEYYVRMMVAWYFATALAKQYDATISYLEERRLEPWVHNKTIQKAIESRRISPQTKDYLRELKVKRTR